MVVTSFVISSSRSHSRGAALAELAIGLPLFLLLLVGLVHFGRMFSQLSWLNYAACQTAEMGSTIDSSYGSGAMQALWDRLYTDAYGQGDSRVDQSHPSAFNAQYDEVNRAVQVSARPAISQILNYAANTLGIGCNGGYLVNTVGSLENFGEFANVPSKFYDCNGQEITSANPPTTPCNWSPPVPPQGSGGWCSCFSGDTPILMADGSEKPISEIKVGDMVMGFNEKTRTKSPAKVSKLFRRESDSFYTLNGKTRVTSEHPFYVNGEWVKTKDLQIGAPLLNSNLGAVPVTSKTLSSEALEVYNLTVDDVHTYFASGVLVHNKTNCETSTSSTHRGAR